MTHTLRSISIPMLLLVTMLTAAAGVVRGDVIQLYPAAEVEPGATAVHLSDVAELDGDYARSFGDVVVADFPAARKDLTLASKLIRDALSKHEANWGKLILRGSMQVGIARRNPTQPPLTNAGVAEANAVPQLASATASADAAPAAGSDAMTLPAAPSLRQYMINWFADQLHADPHDLRVEFDASQKNLLDTSLATYRFELEPVGRDLLGHTTVNVRRYRGTQIVDADRVRVSVAIRRKVVVAVKSLGRGQTITDEDVQLKSMWIDSQIRLPAGDLAAVIGQQTSANMRPGDVFRTDQLRAAVLVRRGQLVTVRWIGQSLVLKTVARANEDGQLNQLISVRNERTRQDFNVRVSGAQEAVVVADAATNKSSSSAVKRGGTP